MDRGPRLVLTRSAELTTKPVEGGASRRELTCERVPDDLPWADPT